MWSPYMESCVIVYARCADHQGKQNVMIVYQVDQSVEGPLEFCSLSRG